MAIAGPSESGAPTEPTGQTHRRRWRVALVGVGDVAEHAHLPALRTLADRTELVAATDVDAARLAAFASRHGIAAHGSLAKLLSDQDPDVVAVCTPPSAHLDAVLEILGAGAWALVEKPPVLSLAEYDRIAAAEREGGPYASVVYQHRFGSGAQRVARLAAAGEFGAPLVAHCATDWYRGSDYFAVPWRGTWTAEGGGTTLSHGVHQMDLLLAVFGQWAEIVAAADRLARAGIETEDVSTALVRFESGAIATVVNSVLSPRQESRLRFDFADATVELTHLYGYSDADWQITAAPHAVDDAGRLARWRGAGEPDVPSSHAAQWSRLLDAMDRGERPPASGDSGRAPLELVTALYRSALTGRPVRRGRYGPGDAFHHRLHGGVPGWAPRPQPLVTHDADASELAYAVGGREVLRFRYGPELPGLECPGPHIHPLRTLAGAVVTGSRPHDHRWHKGLSVGVPQVSGHNFWGGGTYVAGTGYTELGDVGRLVHTGFDEIGPDGFAERIDWVTADGATVLAEARRLRIAEVDEDEGFWTLEWCSELRNVSGGDLDLMSPAVLGRQGAGYCGLFWRGPRSFTGGEVLTSDGAEGEASVLGESARWLAFIGPLDGVDASATVVLVPESADGIRWFVRSAEYPGANPSIAFDDPLVLRPDDTVTIACRVLVADGVWGRDRIAGHVDHPLSRACS